MQWRILTGKFLNSRLPLRIILLVAVLSVSAWFALTSHSAKLEGSAAPQTLRQQTSPPALKRAASDTRATLEKNYGKLPLTFEANRGQTAATSKYVARSAGYNIFLTHAEAVLVFRNGDGVPKQTSSELDNFDEGSSTAGRRARVLSRQLQLNAQAGTKGSEPAVLRMRLDGARTDAQSMEGVDQLPGKVNYFLGSDSSKWLTNIPPMPR